jgi:uncharacterized delta-60 repeat protein
MKTRIKTWLRLLAVCSFAFCVPALAFSQTYIRNTAWNENGTTVGGDPWDQKAARCIITLQNQPDPANNGKMIVVGDFSRYSGTMQPAILRLNTDGSLDATFGTTPINTGAQSILTVTEDPGGNLLIGGMFKQVNGLDIGGIARLDPNGNLDPGFNIGTGFGFGGGYPEVHKILIKNDSTRDANDYGILVGGLFETFKGSDIDPGANSGLVQLNFDGSYNRSFKVTDDCCSGGGVRDMVFDNDGNIVAVGEFGVAGGVTTKRVARLLRNGGAAAQPGIFDPSFMPLNEKVPNNAVNSVLVLPDNKILIGGKFTAFLDVGPGGGGNPMPEVGSYLARLNADGTLDIPSIADQDPDFAPIGLTQPILFSSFEPGVQALKLDPTGRVLVGGRFANPAGNLFRLDASGILDDDFNINTGFNGPVLDFVFRDIVNSEGDIIGAGELIVTVGDFSSFDNVSKQQNVLELGNATVLATNAIKLIATKINNTEVKLQWLGVSDMLTYELQRSNNGSQFQTIVTRSSLSASISFIYNDQAIQGHSVLYYRLIAKGNAGDIHYSDVVKLSFATVQTSLLPLSTTTLKLIYAGNTIYTDKLIIQSITADGKLIWQKETPARSNSISTTISLPVPLSTGFLLLRDERGALLYKTYYLATSK